jgi:hypothetical protein
VVALKPGGCVGVRGRELAAVLKRRRHFAVASCCALLLALVFRDAHADSTREGLDFSRKQRSDSKLFVASILPAVVPIPLNRIHSWTLQLVTTSGVPIEHARIEVDGIMPEHRHGMATKPRVTRELGAGNYLVEGMKFQMAGWWMVVFSLDVAKKRDFVTFNVLVE